MIVVLVLSYSVLEAGYYLFIGAKAGVEAALETPLKKESKRSAHKDFMNMKYISLLPEKFSEFDGAFLQDSVYNRTSGEYVPVTYVSMLVSVDSHPAKWEMIMVTVLTLLHMGMYLWAVVLFIRLIISINKSDIFKWKNVRRLRLLGIALIVGFSCTFIATYLNCRSVGNVFSLQGYNLDISEIVSTTMLVLGLCALIVGEVFAIGLKMQEEQELTI